MIEIEKKFLLTADQHAQLLDGARSLGSKKVEDSYFDTEDYRHTTRDYWLRLRDGSYELKAPLASSGSYMTTNRYRELTDVQEIARELDFSDDLNLDEALVQAGIRPFMTCFTNRKSYEKDGFHIDIDAATYLDSAFEYAVAEIEFLIEDESEADEAERRIMEFAQGFHLATDQVVLGKVAAFLQSEAPQHYEALVDAGVLK